MMSVEELDAHIRDYLEGRSTLDQVEDVLTHTADEVSASGSIQLRRLHNSAWLKIGEFDEQLLSEGELAAELWSILPSRQVQTWNGPVPATVASIGTQFERKAVRWQPLVLTNRQLTTTP